MATVNGEDAEFVIDLSGLPEKARAAVEVAMGADALPCGHSGDYVENDEVTADEHGRLCVAELNIPDELVEVGAKAAAEADGWYWGDGEPVTGRWMEYDFPHPRSTATEYGAKTKPEYRRRTDAALRAVAPLIVAAELARVAETLHSSCRVDDLLGTAEAAARNGVRNELLARASELRGEDLNG